MDKTTLKALKGSIKKWEDVASGKIDEGDCPLCAIFLQRVDEDGNYCDGCPVKQKTGEAECGGSPYQAWVRGTIWVSPNFDGVGYRGRKAKTPKQKALAKAEVKFLKSLLP